MLIVMKKRLWFVIVLLGIQKATSQNCSNLSIRAKDQEANVQEDEQKWAFGVQEIRLLVTYNCPNLTNITMRWTKKDTEEPFPNGSIVVGSRANKEDEISRLKEGNISEYVVLKSPSIEENSVFTVTFNGTQARSKNITVKNCSVNGANGDYKFNEARNESCQVSTRCNDQDTSGTMKQTCGRIAEWNNSTCKKNPLQFDFKTNELKVANGEEVVFSCNKDEMKVFNKKENATESVSKSASLKDHGTNVSCYRISSGNIPDVTSAIVTVLTPPIAKDVTKDASKGKEALLTVPFQANPPVLQEHITITYNGTLFKKFSLQHREGLFYDIVLFFHEVQDDDLGGYEISILGVNETCFPERVNVTATLKLEEEKSFHTGWIISIVLGSLLLMTSIAFVVMFYRQKSRRKDNDISLSSPSPKNIRTQPVQDRAPPPPPQARQQQQQPRQQPQQPRQQQQGYNAGTATLPPRQQNHVNINYHQASDDEFDTDEYEDMNTNPTSPRADRPPMPLPPTPRGNGGRSPHHSPRVGYDNRPPEPPPHRGLPAPRNVGTLPGNRGHMPPPVRELPPPPTQTSRQPQMRGHTPGYGGGGYH